MKILLLSSISSKEKPLSNFSSSIVLFCLVCTISLISDSVFPSPSYKRHAIFFKEPTLRASRNCLASLLLVNAVKVLGSKERKIMKIRGIINHEEGRGMNKKKHIQTSIWFFKGKVEKKRGEIFVFEYNKCFKS